MRRFGDPIGLGARENGEVAQIRALLSKLDMTAHINVYVRQSDPDAEAINYTKAQMEMSKLLVAAGVAEDRIRVKQADMGISGAKSTRHRADYKSTQDEIRRGECKTLMALSISRIHRDPTGTHASQFSSLMGANGVSVLVRLDGEWQVLDMAKSGDRRIYIDHAWEASDERNAIRERAIQSKEASVAEGNWSGGGIVPLGWRKVPGVKRSNGNSQSPIVVVYEPHKRVKLEIMQASLQPHIKTWAGLWRHVRDAGLRFPPFDLTVRDQAFSSSPFRRARVRDADSPGAKRKMRDDESCLPSLAMLRAIILEPLALGDRFYGSGRAGAYRLRKAAQEAALDEVPVDTLTNPGRDFVGCFEDQALCTTEEEIALFYAVQHKWSKIDLKTAREGGYEDVPENTAKSAGNHKGRVRGENPVNAWAGKVWCGKHGKTDDEFSLTHPLTWCHNPNRDGKSKSSPFETWRCAPEKGETGPSCTNWTGDDLMRILDRHLRHNMGEIINGDQEIFEGLFVRQAQAQEARRSLESNLEATQKELALQTVRADARARAFDDDPETMAIEYEAFTRKNIKPLTISIKQIKRDLAALEAQTSAIDIPLEAHAQIKSELQAIYERYHELSIVNKRNVIEMLVASVVVVAGDGMDGQECAIWFEWANGNTDLLVGWRGWPIDVRAWTAEEDEAIRQLWGVEMDFAKITTRLQPGRKMLKIRKRAIALGIAKQRPTPRVWQNAQFAGERSFRELNPEVLYMMLHPRAGVQDIIDADGAQGMSEDSTLPKVLVVISEPAYNNESWYHADMPASVEDGLITRFIEAGVESKNKQGIVSIEESLCLRY